MAWFEFKIEETEDEGVEPGRLARLLQDLSAAFYSIARVKIGAAPRPGRRTLAEETLAGFRVLKITPGSMTIELVPPPEASQDHLNLFNEARPDDVAYGFYQEVLDIAARKAPEYGRWDIRRNVRAVLDDAASIGTTAQVLFHPFTSRSGQYNQQEFQTRFRVRDVPSEVIPERKMTRRTMSGHAYMVDVEPGRQRLRVKLPDGRDITLETDPALLSVVPSALDRAVEVDVDEEMEGPVVTRRVARDVRPLPSYERGSDKPPKTIDELAREQELEGPPPDYVQLASEVWAEEADIIEFEKYLSEIHRASGE